jgi:hypothetical protein
LIQPDRHLPEEIKQEAIKAKKQAGDALKAKAAQMVESPLEAGADALASVARTAGSIAEAVGGESPIHCRLPQERRAEHGGRQLSRQKILNGLGPAFVGRMDKLEARLVRQR